MGGNVREECCFDWTVIKGCSGKSPFTAFVHTVTGHVHTSDADQRFHDVRITSFGQSVRAVNIQTGANEVIDGGDPCDDKAASLGAAVSLSSHCFIEHASTLTVPRRSRWREGLKNAK